MISAPLAPLAPLTLGEHLKALRTARRLSQQRISDQLVGYIGMQQCIIGRWERDALAPDAGQLEILLDTLDASPADRLAARALAKLRCLRPTAPGQAA